MYKPDARYIGTSGMLLAKHNITLPNTATFSSDMTPVYLADLPSNVMSGLFLFKPENRETILPRKTG
jgi:uncharacterized lipoprotein YbaY